LHIQGVEALNFTSFVHGEFPPVIGEGQPPL